MLMEAEQKLSPTRGEDILDLQELTSGGSLSLDEIFERIDTTGRDVRGDVFALVLFDRLKPIPGIGYTPARYSLPQFFERNSRGRLR